MSVAGLKICVIGGKRFILRSSSKVYHKSCLLCEKLFSWTSMRSACVSSAGSLRG